MDLTNFVVGTFVTYTILWLIPIVLVSIAVCAVVTILRNDDDEEEE
ncbi:hypothetical protein FACS1894111_08860 [Clostridia bacterium]|nr:hypothetical protein FACS1894111_08860 [Clostridia bacterium]